MTPDISLKFHFFAKIMDKLRKVWLLVLNINIRKTIYLHQNCTLDDEGYQLKLPLNLETIIPADDSVRLLNQFMKVLNLTDLLKHTSYRIRRFNRL